MDQNHPHSALNILADIAANKKAAVEDYRITLEIESDCEHN